MADRKKPKENNENVWTEEVQRVLINFMLSDADAFTQCRNIVQDDYFDDPLRPAVRFVLEYADTYRVLPTAQQVVASTRVNVEPFDGVEQAHRAWFLETIEKFCRHRALELTVLKAVDMIGEGRYGEVEQRVKDAMTISLMSDLGMDYFADPRGRMERLRDSSSYITTGWKLLDYKLYGGFVRGALNIFCGGSGSGKSLVLQNLAVNYVERGFNVVYFTLELAEDLVATRIDAMMTGFGTKDILRRIDDAAPMLTMKGRHSGKLRIKKLPEAGTNANVLRSYLKELEIKTGERADVILVDYLDLMHPCNGRIDPSDLFVKDKYTSEELRALAHEMNVICVSASQLNRSSIEAVEFDHSHIAGGISKINTADNVFGIFAPAAMRDQGRYQIQFLKTRSAAAVGQKIEMRFDPVSLRIVDPEEDDGTKPLATAALRDQGKTTGTQGPASPAPISDKAASVLNKLGKLRSAAGSPPAS